MKPVRSAVALWLSLASAVAFASPITYTFDVPGADGSLNGSSFFGQNITVVVHADTAQVTPMTVGGDPGNCVAGSSANAQVGATSVPLLPPVFVCASTNSFVIYVGPINNAGAPDETFVAGGFSSPIGSYDLRTSYPLTVNQPGEVGAGASLNTNSGTLFLTTNPSVSFQATVSAPTAVPTLGIAPLAALGLLVAFASIVVLRRRAG